MVLSLTKRTLTLNCPYCGSFFETDVPDKSHLCFSLEKLPNGKTREAIAKVYTCTNTNCSEKMTIYCIMMKHYSQIGYDYDLRNNLN